MDKSWLLQASQKKEGGACGIGCDQGMMTMLVYQHLLELSGPPPELSCWAAQIGLLVLGYQGLVMAPGHGSWQQLLCALGGPLCTRWDCVGCVGNAQCAVNCQAGMQQPQLSTLRYVSFAKDT